jgi:hypothetical protein
MHRLTILIVAIACPVYVSFSTEPDERWRIPDSALSVVAGELHPSSPLAVAAEYFLSTTGMSQEIAMKRFGEIAASSEPAHLSPCRFHRRGKSVLQQLEELRPDDIQAGIRACQDAVGIGAPVLPSIALSGQNVISNFLLHHLVALHIAEAAAKAQSNRAALLKAALHYEAIAEGFLVDGFSSGHMLVPLGDFLCSLHSVNNVEAHDFYSSVGLFVINSRGEAWQTFGDGVMQWYPATYMHAHDACCVSMREVFLVYSFFEDSLDIPQQLTLNLDLPPEHLGLTVRRWLLPDAGDYFYTTLKLPSLLGLPMPVSATWSVRSEKAGWQGKLAREHFPQICGGEEQPAFADSSLTGIERRLLYSWDSMPDWMLPDAWVPAHYSGGKNIRDLSDARRDSIVFDLIRWDTTTASVRFVQEVNYPPSYAGLILGVGWGIVDDGSPASGIAGISIGYAPRFAFLRDFFVPLRISVAASYSHWLDGTNRKVLQASAGSTIPFAGSSWNSGSSFRFLENLRLDIGWSWGLTAPLQSSGLAIGIGLESGVIPIGFTYAGVLVRPMLSYSFMKPGFFGASLQVLLI